MKGSDLSHVDAVAAGVEHHCDQLLDRTARKSLPFGQPSVRDRAANVVPLTGDVLRDEIEDRLWVLAKFGCYDTVHLERDPVFTAGESNHGLQLLTYGPKCMRAPETNGSAIVRLCTFAVLSSPTKRSGYWPCRSFGPSVNYPGLDQERKVAGLPRVAPGIPKWMNRSTLDRLKK